MTRCRGLMLLISCLNLALLCLRGLQDHRLGGHRLMTRSILQSKARAMLPRRKYGSLLHLRLLNLSDSSDQRISPAICVLRCSNNSRSRSRHLKNKSLNSHLNGNLCLHSNLCSNKYPFNGPQYLPYPEYNHPQYNHPQNHRELSSRATCALRSHLSTTLRRPDRHRLLQKACLHPHSNREVEIHRQCAIASSAPMLRLRQAVPSTHDQTARVGV